MGTAGRGAIDGRIREGIGLAVLCSGDMRRGPTAWKRPKRLHHGRPEDLQFRVLDPPSAVQLLNDQFRVQEHLDALGTELPSQQDRTIDTDVFGHIVGPNA